MSVVPVGQDEIREIDPETGKPVIDADFERAKKWIADNL